MHPTPCRCSWTQTEERGSCIPASEGQGPRHRPIVVTSWGRGGRSRSGIWARPQEGRHPPSVVTQAALCLLPSVLQPDFCVTELPGTVVQVMWGVTAQPDRRSPVGGQDQGQGCVATRVDAAGLGLRAGPGGVRTGLRPRAGADPPGGLRTVPTGRTVAGTQGAVGGWLGSVWGGRQAAQWGADRARGSRSNTEVDSRHSAKQVLGCAGD